MQVGCVGVRFHAGGAQVMPPRTGLQLDGHSPHMEGIYRAQSLSGDEVASKAPYLQLL